MAENTLALLHHLTSSESPLPELASAGYSAPRTVFFQFFEQFLIYSYSTAKIMYSATFLLALVVARVTYADPAPALKRGTGFVGEHIRGVVAVAGAFVGATIGVNVVAFLMSKVFDRSLSWFSSVFACTLLYGPAALAGKCTLRRLIICTVLIYNPGGLASQLLVGRVREHTAFASTMLLQSFLATLTQFLNIGSGGALFLSSAPFIPSLLLNALLTAPGDDISLWTYALGQLSPLVSGTTLTCGVLDVFVPLVSLIERVRVRYSEVVSQDRTYR